MFQGITAFYSFTFCQVNGCSVYLQQKEAITIFFPPDSEYVDVIQILTQIDFSESQQLALGHYQAIFLPKNCYFYDYVSNINQDNNAFKILNK